MSAARQIVDLAREAGLSEDQVDQLRRFLAENAARARELLDSIAADALNAETEPARPKRLPGGWKGRVRIADDFDAPLSESLERGFYESILEPEPRE
jgi:hypothetical protein